MPRVTVVTPNYNHAKYLPERIDSILAQTFQDFELLILEDASTDNSREVIESYTGHQNVRAAFNKENNGSPFKQWNLGLSQAKGEYVWFAESDDYADPCAAGDPRRSPGSAPQCRACRVSVVDSRPGQ